MDLWQIVFALTGTLGGIGAVVVAVVKFGGGIISKRLFQKYSHKLDEQMANHKSMLDKNLESHRMLLEKTNYVSKVRFDAEFRIYGELSKAFFDLDKAVGAMIPPMACVSGDSEKQRELEEDAYKLATERIVRASDKLHQNAPFIQEHFFEEFSEIVNLSNIQMQVFGKHLNPNFDGSIVFEDYERSITVHTRFLDLSKNIREYLSGLEVMTSTA